MAPKIWGFTVDWAVQKFNFCFSECACDPHNPWTTFQTKRCTIGCQNQHNIYRITAAEASNKTSILAKRKLASLICNLQSRQGIPFYLHNYNVLKT